jgi:cell division protein FtsW
MRTEEDSERRHDNVLFGATCVLVALGLVMIYSVAVGSVEDMRQGRAPEATLWRQLGAVGLGMALCCALSRLRTDTVGKVAVPMFAVVVLLLMAVLVPGVAVAGEYKRWIRLPGGLTFQPSALAPVALIVLIAELGQLLREDPSRYLGFRRIGIGAVALCGLLVVVEPDLASSVLVAAVGVATLAASGLRPTDLKRLLAGAGVALVLAIGAVGYMRERFVEFFRGDPGEPNMQIERCLIALGAGGLDGRGLGQGITKFGYLPEAHTDTILAAMGEEMGFLLTLAVVALYAVLFHRGYRIAVHARSPHARSLAFGLTTLIGVQALINMAVVTGMAPTTGVPLPFVSAGGTSVLVLLSAVGLILAASRECVEGPIEVAEVDADRPVERRNRRAHLPRSGDRRLAAAPRGKQ